jgi:hypothetical protein
MTVIFELNNKQKVSLDKDKIKMERACFPIKVTLVNNKGRESERIIFIRERKGIPRILIA